MIDDDIGRRSPMNKFIEIAMEKKHREFKKEDYHVLAVKVLIERKLKND